jgi:hypothetical protein
MEEDIVHEGNLDRTDTSIAVEFESEMNEKRDVKRCGTVPHTRMDI